MKYFIPYILLGAVFAGYVDKNRVQECNEHIGIHNVLIASFSYPILIIVAMVTDKVEIPEGENGCGE